MTLRHQSIVPALLLGAFLAVATDAPAQVAGRVPLRLRAPAAAGDTARHLVVLTPRAESIGTARDRSYVDSDTLKRFDVYHRAGRRTGPRPVVVFANSGSGTMRRWQPYQEWARLVANEGFAAVLYDAALPTAGADLRALLARLRAEAPALGLDADRMVLWASSSNANVATPVALDPATPGVRGYVLYYGAGIIAAPRIDVPVLIARAGLDQPGLNRSLDSLAMRLTASGAAVTSLTYPGGVHGFDWFDRTETSRQIIERTLEFMRDATDDALHAERLAGSLDARAASALLQDRWTDAVSLFGQLALARPDDGTVAARLGAAQLAVGDPSSALASFTRARRLGTQGAFDLGVPALRAATRASDTAALADWTRWTRERLPPHLIGVLARDGELGSLFTTGARPGDSRTVALPIAATAWTATDSLKVATHLGRPSLYINRGAAVNSGADFTEGTLEFDFAATELTTFLGITFHARSPQDAEVVFFRIGQSGTSEAVQYAPALNSITAAWQVYHGEGANAVATLRRGEWTRVRVVVAGRRATVTLNDDTTATLVVPRLAGTGGTAIGIWAGGFGRGAYFSNLRYTPAESPAPIASAPVLPEGTITDWEISPAYDAATLTPGVLPRLDSVRWEPVQAEPTGFVLLNRHRTAPIARLPLDPNTREVLRDSVMRGRVPGSKVVLARRVITAERAGLARLRFGYSDGATIYLNGQPLYLGMDPQFFNDGLGVMEHDAHSVYLPLRRGRNELVVAVTEFTGGWAFGARLEPQVP